MANANVNTLQFGSSMTIKELRKFIPVVGKELTVIIQSEPGCGKTSLLAMMAEDNGDEWRKPGMCVLMTSGTTSTWTALSRTCLT